MKKRSLLFFILSAVIAVLSSVTVFANAAEPPNITVLIPNAPDGMEVSLVFPEENGQDILWDGSGQLKRGWESYYRFRILDFDRIDLSGVKISVTYDKFELTLDLPETDVKSYNNIFTVDLDDGDLRYGTYPGRYLLIAGIRVLSTLLMEGAVFLLFGYFKKRSWIVFLAVNLATQAFLNIVLYGSSIDSYVLLGYVIIEVLIFAAEAVLFPALLKEHARTKAVLYALAANAVSLIGGGLMISHMPL